MKRRAFLHSLVGGSLLLPGVLAQLLADDSADPLAPKSPHYGAKAKRVIFLFMAGGISQVGALNPGDGALVVLYSNDLESTHDAVVAAGGRIVREIFDFPDGRRFHFTDPSGVELAVWSRLP